VTPLLSLDTCKDGKEGRGKEEEGEEYGLFHN